MLLKPSSMKDKKEYETALHWWQDISEHQTSDLMIEHNIKKPISKSDIVMLFNRYGKPTEPTQGEEWKGTGESWHMLSKNRTLYILSNRGVLVAEIDNHQDIDFFKPTLEAVEANVKLIIEAGNVRQQINCSLTELLAICKDVLLKTDSVKFAEAYNKLSKALKL